ncbi:hypothetical protein MBAV_005545 [Candidatus Magnetobacterium bavaricum]|uniref:Uncharacterized protein n=1 Tax=Candidatus Magnetobacterium bavaricum TaxID=29290 RepID=A0A0F3GKB2_9BACT|nr:hypothetical protein MBAV_005545 [Candidatus Magnetobacterium bavaricum]
MEKIKRSFVHRIRLFVNKTSQLSIRMLRVWLMGNSFPPSLVSCYYQAPNLCSCSSASDKIRQYQVKFWFLLISRWQIFPPRQTPSLYTHTSQTTPPAPAR